MNKELKKQSYGIERFFRTVRGHIMKRHQPVIISQYLGKRTGVKAFRTLARTKKASHVQQALHRLHRWTRRMQEQEHQAGSQQFVEAVMHPKGKRNA